MVEGRLLGVEGQKAKVLVVFDFDKTIMDMDVDEVAISLAKDKNVVNELKTRFRKGNSDSPVMDVVYQYLLDECGIGWNKIREAMLLMDLAPGMRGFLKWLGDGVRKDRFEAIITSNANTIVIDEILKALGLRDVFSRVYSNTATVKNDRLYLVAYHSHHHSLCPPHLCKGTILKEHIAKGNYSNVTYVGDGKNDLCPAMFLNERGNVICPRKDYELSRIISTNRLPQDFRTVDNKTVDPSNMDATVVDWSTADEIQKHLQTFL